MKKYLLIFLFIIFAANTAESEITYYNYSTLHVGPGIIHKKIIAPLVPWTINVLEIDLTNPLNQIETVKAKNKIVGQERTSSMASRSNYELHQVIGAVNGDFYGSGGVPLTTQLINGQMLKNPYSAWWSLAFSDQDKPDISQVQFNGVLISRSGQNEINGVNQERGTDQMILYNSFYGSSTGTNEWGSEILVNPISNWIVNDTVLCVVEAQGIGNMSIPTGKAVLSGHGSSKTFLDQNTALGDTLKIVLNLMPSLPRLVQSIGGNRMLLQNGIYTGGSNTDIHPRTAAGFNADSTVLYLMTVDGRQSSSRGMSYREIADFMKGLGAQDVINLDGGGSTTMVVRGEIENSPSDVAGERSVASALMTISTAPSGTLSAIQVEPDNKRVFLKNSIQFHTTGWDEYYNPVTITSSEIQYTVNSSLGSVNTDGLFVAANQVDSGYVFITYNGLKDSAYVFIKTIKSVDIKPESIVTDTLQTIQFKVTPMDVDNLNPEIPLNEYSWQSLNPDIGTVNETGRFQGLSEGVAKVVVSYLDASDTAEVKIEVGQGTGILDSMDTTIPWRVDGEFYDAQATTFTAVDSPKTFGTGALRLNYQFVRNADARSWVFLNTDISIYGLPDSIKLDIKSNQKKHIADILVSDDNNELFSASTGVFNKTSQQYETYSIPMENFNAVEPGSEFNYPIRLKAIKIKLGYEGPVGGLNQGTLYFDNLRVVYPNYTTSIPVIKSHLPGSLKLNQNYPNPFNPITAIGYQVGAIRKSPVHVELIVYNVLGQKVRTLVNGNQAAGKHSVLFNADDLASGVYLYRLSTGNGLVQTKKMILLR